MTIWLWKVLDNRVIDACLGTAVWLGALIVAAVLLPHGSGLENVAVFVALWTTLVLICQFFAALFRRG